MDLRFALVLSLWVHIVGLALLRYAPPDSIEIRPWPSIVEVEISAPSPEKPDSVKPQPQDKSPAGQTNAPVLPRQAVIEPQEEDSISLESKEPQYLSYLQQIKNRIKDEWEIPRNLELEKKGGKLLTIFTLDNQGRLLLVKLESSSGRPLLDAAAIRAVQAAAPYDPFPDHIKLKRLNIRAYFDYRIEYVGVN